MTSHRLTGTSATLLVLALSAAAPAVAGAGSLLSGYGGPGQGNQAILGSALLNGPSGGGGSTGGGSTGGGSTGGGSLAIAAGRQAAAGSRTGRASAGAVAGKHLNARVRRASTSGSHPYRDASDSAASGAGNGGSQTLGLSGADVLYVLLAVAALGATAAFTRSLTREPGRGLDAR